MPLPTLVENAAQTLKRRLGEQFGERIVSLRVFGSRARGDWHEESDLDVFILIDREDRDLQDGIVKVAYEVYDELELPFIISPYIVPQEHFDLLVRRERRIARDILEEGVAI